VKSARQRGLSRYLAEQKPKRYTFSDRKDYPGGNQRLLQWQKTELVPVTVLGQRRTASPGVCSVQGAPGLAARPSK